MVIVDWYSGCFDIKSLVPNPNAASLISCLREWFINTAVWDVLWSDGGPPFGSMEVNNFLARWGVQWCPSSPHYLPGCGVCPEVGQRFATQNVGVAKGNRGPLMRSG